jgi:hypothetical protein
MKDPQTTQLYSGHERTKVWRSEVSKNGKLS